MKILIHASLDFVEDLVETKNYIENNSKHKVILPDTTRYQHIRDIQGNDKLFTKIKNRLTKENLRHVEECDCLLILNYTHRSIENYIGGNSFLEMVVAFYLNKPIYILNDIPENLTYAEEIKALYPIVVNNINNFINII